MRKVTKDDIDLLKEVINWIAIIGFFCLILSDVLLLVFGSKNELFFLFSIGLAVFILGITLGYNNKSIKDQKELKNDIKLIKQKLGIDDIDYHTQESEKKSIPSITQESESSKPNLPGLENIRIAYEIYNKRNLELASYIRLLDAGIWGFLGFMFIELFKDNWEILPQRIVIFSSILFLSMFAWRYWANKYNDDIIEGYIKILTCECILDIPKEISLKSSLISKMDCFYPNQNKVKEYKMLIQDLREGKKPATGHKELNCFANLCKIIALVGIIAGFFLWKICVVCPLI